MPTRIKTSQILILHLVNWLTICIAYPIVVRPDPYIGIVYVFGLVTNLFSFAGLSVVNHSFLKKEIKSERIYFVVFCSAAFVVNQLSYLIFSRPIPVLDLGDTSNEYYKGENLLFTLSFVTSFLVIVGMIFLYRKIIEEKREL